MKFKDLKLKNELLNSLNQMGFEEPTPIQQQAIPIALEGRDLIGQAQTGTGKTAAFGLPMLNKLDRQQSAIQGLVVAPTRELALQVQEEIYRLGKDLRARTFVVYGGTPINKQIDRLKRYQPQIVVGTPGRILDLIRRKALAFNYLETLVLDEADEMLNMGFIEDIKAIIAETPNSRQTLLFSATMPKEIKVLGEQFLKNPSSVKIEAKEMTADLIDQYFVKCRDNEKFDILSRLLDVQNPKQAIVFCRTKKRVDEVGRGLGLRGYDAELIHGDITQQKRTSVINEFRKGKVELLVATDVAARGLDISGVTHVYNYDIPQDPESYVHRIGRTGRAGSDGESITFVTHNEMAYLRTIEDLTRKKMMPLKPPTPQEAQAGQVQQLIDEINITLESDKSSKYFNTAKLLLEHYQSTELIAALLDQIIQDTTNIEVRISPQKPLPDAKGGRRSRGRGRRRNQQGRSRRQNRQGRNRRGKQRQNNRNKDKQKAKGKKVNNNFTIKRR